LPQPSRYSKPGRVGACQQVAAAIEYRLQRLWNEDSAREEIRGVRGHNADHGKGQTIQVNRPSHDMRVRAELSLPERLTEYRYLGGSAAVAFVRSQKAAQQRAADSKHMKITAGHQQSSDAPVSRLEDC
jgi:hypothetical protein